MTPAGRASQAGHIRVGTSGWSYPSGQGTWNGIFYPAANERPRGSRANGAGDHGDPAPRRGSGRPEHESKGASERVGGSGGAKPPGKKFDELAFYAEHFDTVEVNSSFYRVPAIDTTKAWARRTPAGFEFSLKLYQKFTHPDMFLNSTGQDPADLDRRDVDEFRAAIDPLARAGKLGALLAQFPPSFKNDAHARGYLEWLLEAFTEYPLAVELRHRSFSEDPGETMRLLAAHGAALVQIDEPKFRDSIRQSRLPNVKTFYYMRLHGRNAAEWWTHEKSKDRYNYLYSESELEPIVEAAEEASREVKKAYVYANNHFSAKSVANAATIKHKLGQPLDGEYPETFVEQYPDLRSLVRVVPSRPSDTLV